LQQIHITFLMYNDKFLVFGQGSCNTFGCNCDGECLKGEWTQRFLQRNLGYGIETLEEIHYWGEGLYFPQKINMIVIKNSEQT